MNEGYDFQGQLVPASPSVGQIEQSGNYDRARLGFFANRVLVFDILGDTGDTVVFSTPSNETIIIRSLWVFNSGASPNTLNLKILPSGVVAANWINKMKVSIPSEIGIEWPSIDDVLEPGYQILAWGSTPDELLLKINGVYVGGQ